MTPHRQYWSNHYARTSVAPLPSQFAAFVAGEELPAEELEILEIGCGNGRDAGLLSQRFRNYTGIDRSPEAIQSCGNLPLERSAFFVHEIAEGLTSAMKEVWGQREKFDVIYSRFFIHSISDEQETSFFELVNQGLCVGGRLYVEYRTSEDEVLPKETEDHFRRFVDPGSFAERAGNFGLKLVYGVEGRGYAKYGEDDAHVARQVFVKLA